MIGTLLLSAVLAGAAFAQDAKELRDRQLQEKTDDLMGLVEELTGLAFEAKVPAAYQSRKDFEKFLRASLEKDFPKEKRDGAARLYQGLGLLPEGFDLEGTIIEMTKTQTLAYYDPETRRMYVLEHQHHDEDELHATLVHELVHAAQDQRHRLDAIDKEMTALDNGDAVSAFDFLVEGEASFWEECFELERDGNSLDDLSTDEREEIFGYAKDFTSRDILGADEEDEELPAEEREAMRQLRRLPKIFVRALQDPYLRGMYAAYRIHRAGGRRALRELFKDAKSLTTRDMMFPEEWLASGRGVAQIKLADLQGALGASWKRTYAETLGALTLHTLFEDQRPEANLLAKAWDGDRVELWQSDAASFIAGVAVFASPFAASTFVKQLERLYREEWTRGRKIDEHAAEFTHLSSGADQFAVLRDGKKAYFLRGAPPVPAAKILETLAASEIKLVEPAKAPAR